MGWLLAVAAIAIGWAIISAKLEAKRREMLAKLATQGGWDFSAEKDTGIGRLCDFDMFNRGDRRYAFNTITGKVDYGELHCELDMGDFSYTTHSTDSKGHRSSTTHRFSYCVIRLPFRDTPALKVRRENLLDKLVQAVGFDDIDFESDEFSRKFCVTSNDKKFAYDVLHPRALEYFLDIDPPALIEIHAGRLCCTNGVRRWDDEEFRKVMHWSKNFVSLWPEHLSEGLRKRTI